MNKLEDLYSAIAYAETGHLKDPYIRTQARGTGSSAYGPVQINKAALTGPGYKDIGFTREEDKFIKEKISQKWSEIAQNEGVKMKNISLLGIVEDLVPVREREESVNKFEVIEAVKNYQMIGGQLFKDNGIIEVAKQLVGIAESAQNHVLSETDDWFDSVSVKRNMKELKGLTGQFKKAALEANAVNERLSALYEDMGHILNRYYDIEEAMDPVGKEDGDIDNDGDQDDSDEYLAKRRKAISKAIKKQNGDK